jgi:hypothetical protein
MGDPRHCLRGYTIETVAHGPTEELADKVAESAANLLKAFAAESALKKHQRRGNFDRAEFARTRHATQECAETYAYAMREYIQFFQRTALEEGHPPVLSRPLPDIF